MCAVKKLISSAVQHICMIGKNEKGGRGKKTTACKQLYFAAGVNNVAGIEMAVKTWESMLVGCVDSFEICT